MRSAPEQQFIDSKLDEALPEFGLAPESPLRAIVDKDAVVVERSGITGQKAYGVKVVRDGMPDVSVRERLRELAQDFMYRHHFPPQGKAVSARDMKSLSENFDKIAKGEIVVR